MLTFGLKVPCIKKYCNRHPKISGILRNNILNFTPLCPRKSHFIVVCVWVCARASACVQKRTSV